MKIVDEDSPQVKIPPPFIALVFILLGFGVNKLSPLPVSDSWRTAGYALIAIGLLIIIQSAALFRRSRTKLEPWKTTSSIVTTGVYRFSRNPIYLSFVLISMGIGLLAGNGWILIMQVPFVIVMSYYVILKEERYLADKFGLMYTSYADKVRRWL